MRRSILMLFVFVFTAGLALTAGSALAEHGYAGVDGCKMCHKKEATGDQYGKWAESAHAKAYEVLGTDAAKEAAAKAGVTGNPQEAAECLGCHVTAYGVDASLVDAKKWSMEQGVGCESCHGPGADYKSMKVMKDLEAAKAAGLIIPTEETCKQCHNEKSPTFKGFDFKEAAAKIAHPDPSKAK